MPSSSSATIANCTCCADPIATAAPAWMEALFLPRPEVECIIYEGMRIAGLPEG
jgi:hypothetical protein